MDPAAAAREAADADFEAKGQAMAIAFLEQAARVRADAGRRTCRPLTTATRPARSLDEVIFCYPGLEAITVYRLAHELHELGVPLIPRMMTEWAHSGKRASTSTRAPHRQALLHRSRHGRGDRRNVRDRRTMSSSIRA